jgi:hypothetical protein
MESASSLAASQAVELGLTHVLEAIDAALPLSDEHADALKRAAEALRAGARS